VLTRILVAPVTTTVRSIPSEVPIGIGDGLPHDGAVSLDNVQLYNRDWLTDLICVLDPVRMAEVCRAVRIAINC
jgi:mRNA interferase MazF